MAFFLSSRVTPGYICLRPVPIDVLSVFIHSVCLLADLFSPCDLMFSCSVFQKKYIQQPHKPFLKQICAQMTEGIIASYVIQQSLSLEAIQTPVLDP